MALLKFHIFLIIFLLNIAFSAFSQERRSPKKMKRQASLYLEEENYYKALPLYQKLDSLSPDNPEYKFYFGLTCLFVSDCKTQAIDHLEQAQKQGYKHEKLFYFLARAYHLNYFFDEAIEHYKKYQKQQKKWEEEEKKLVKRQIEMCENGKMLSEAIYNFEIKNIGSTINTEHPEYAPVISADESVLIFASRRPGSTGELQNLYGQSDPKGEYYEDIFISVKNENSEWSEPKGISDSINAPGHDASIGLTADGQKLLLYKSDQVLWGDLYMSVQKGEKWSVPKPLNENVNSEYWEGSASISADEQKLYFSSNRPGGYGGKDLYVSVRLPDGSWALPKNLGPEVNTPYDEDAPFIHPDGNMLYFSSKGHTSMGGYDIFLAVYEKEKWKMEKNLGRPVNTPGDEIYFVLSADGETGYFSSDRKGSVGRQDIFEVKMPDDFGRPPVLTMMRGIIKAGDSPIEAKVIVVDNEAGKIQGIYRSNAATGKYLLIVPAGKNYNITFETEGYLFYSENIHFPGQDTFVQINKDIELLSPEIGNRIILKNIFFKPGQSELAPQSKAELDKLYALLQTNPALQSEIAAYIDTIEEKLPLKIAQERAETVVNYLVEKGIDVDRLFPKGYVLSGGAMELASSSQIELKLLGGFFEEMEGGEAQEELKMDLPSQVGETARIRTIYFDFNKAFLKPESKAALQKIYNYLKEHPDYIIEISAHTDSIGDDSYNKGLSERRAFTVVNYLMAKGIPGERLFARGYGDKKPVATNKTEEGRQQNRRVEVKVLAIQKSSDSSKDKIKNIYPVK